MKKRLIALMVSGVIMASALTGCASQTTQDDSHVVVDGKMYKAVVIENTHISVEQKDGRVLHKGDIAFFKSGSGRFATGIDLTEMYFDCGKILTSNTTYSLSEEMPDEEDYDHICEDCFKVD